MIFTKSFAKKMEKNFEKLSIEEMSLVSGGDAVTTIMGYSCGLAVSGVVAGGFGVAVTGMIFGPTCVGLGIVKLIG